MRVIAGTYRSRLLVAPRGLATRPTSDRLRETLFNILATRIEGAVFADLYAGSGAVGIEALSRGARLVYFVDNAPPAVTAKLIAEVEKATKSPDIVARIQELGSVPGTAFGKDFGKFMEAETAKWAAVIKASGARAD